MKYGLNDIWITPAEITTIEHRSECNPYDKNNMLPLFTAPMNSVIDENNYQIFLDNKINTIIPRGVNFNIRWELSTKTFVAVGLDEFVKFVNKFKINFSTTTETRYICVDIANGHMRKLINLCGEAKRYFKEKLIIMAGNIANPKIYYEYTKAGIDLVRCSVGSGTSCITACCTGIFYPMASLLLEIQEIKKDIIKLHYEKKLPLIIADGGFNSYDKIIKALALGADYVMIGKLFAQTEEGAGQITEHFIEPNCLKSFLEEHPDYPDNVKWPYNNGKLHIRIREYYGMSTKRAQCELGSTQMKTSEGIEFKVPILYKLNNWCDSFIDYLRSAMSYTNSRVLKDFKKSKYEVITPLEYKSFYK